MSNKLSKTSKSSKLGSRSPLLPQVAKLTDEQVDEIRAWWKEYEQRPSAQAFARSLGITEKSLSRIAHGGDVRGLAPDVVAGIRTWFAKKTTIRQEAAKYNLSPGAFVQAARGRTYRWVPMEGDAEMTATKNGSRP